MAGIPVNNNLNVLSNIVTPTGNGQDNRSMLDMRQEEALQDSFDVVMSRLNTKAGAQMAAQGKVQAITKVSASSDVKTMSANIAAGAGSDAKSSTVKSDALKSDAQTESAQQTETENTTVQAKDDTTGAEMTENGQEEALTKAGEELVEDVAQEMGVTPEEVVEAMEVLGLSVIQLLDPENMKMLLLELSGNEDPLSIITNGELYAHFQNLSDMVVESLDDLAAELGISREELNTLIENMTAAQTQPDEMIVPEELLTPGEEAEDVNLEGMKDYAVTVHKDGETVAVKVKVDDASGSQSMKEEVVQTAETQTRHDAKSGNKNAFAEGREEGQTAGNFLMEQPATQPVISEAAEPIPVMERFISTEDIMNQIMEYMKINVKEGVQELELQLHPASLGTVNVQIAAKDGAITAQFTAQNEVVKAAIETQLIQLKNQFEEQGIKVDAVEVAVADYRFENSFSNQEQNAEAGKENGKKSRRSINLNEIDMEEMPEDMDDSERIAADMMARSGNTVDYTA